jgi:transposase
VLARGSRLMDIHGVGPVVAARALADVGDVTRFADRNRFASWTGTAPLDASSGEHNRHRLSRAGNRRMNHMIHIAAVTQLRLDTDGRALPKQASRGQLAAGGHAVSQAQDRRCHLPPTARRHTPRHQPEQPRPTGGSRRALRGVSRIQRGRPAPAHRHFGSPLPGPAHPTLPAIPARANPHAASAPRPPRRRDRGLDNRGEPIRRGSVNTRLAADAEAWRGVGCSGVAEVAVDSAGRRQLR